MSLEAKSLVIALNLKVLEQIRKENQENTVWGDSFQSLNGGFMKLDILRTNVSV